MQFNPKKYGPVLERFIDLEQPPALGMGNENREILSELNELTVASAFVHAQPTDSDMALCCLSGLWLYHNFLERSHAISQNIDTAEGSFWHGIMHRREGDFSNAKYWFRQVGDHEIFPLLTIAAQTLTREAGSDWKSAANPWDAAAFVDLCREAGQGVAKLRPLAEQIATIEWQLLFDFCYDRAT